MKNLILKNYFFVNNPQGGKVESFYEWLIKLKLHGKQSRARSRFVKMITERTREIDEERIKLAEQYSEKNKEGKVIYLTAKKDKDGKEVVKNNAYVLEDENKFEKEFTKLKGKHKEAISKRDKQIEEYNKLLEEEIEIELHKIAMDDVPEDIATGQLQGIFEIIDEKN